MTKVEEKSCLKTSFFVMLNHYFTINTSCTIINCGNVNPTVRLIYTVPLLILTVVTPLYDLKVHYDYSVPESKAITKDVETRFDTSN